MRNREYKIIIAIAVLVSIVATAVAFAFNIVCGFVCLSVCICLNAVYIYLTKKRYSQIESLNDYLNMVCSGDYSMDISDNVEGELSILKNNLYKVVVQLQSSNEALQNDKKYLADSLADISHQLKTPLTSMMVMADLISREENEEKREEFVEIIENQLDKMKWLISTLLKLSKLDAGTAEFNRTQVNINSVIDESLKPFLLTLDIKNITVEKSIDDFVFTGDINWSVEAVGNIIKNCIEHTDDNGKLVIKTVAGNVCNELIIADNGCGIDEEDLPHIFERFYHGKNSSPDSVGIGLALSKEIFENQKASVSVESQANIGTKFNIKFYKTII